MQRFKKCQLTVSFTALCCPLLANVVQSTWIASQQVGGNDEVDFH